MNRKFWERKSFDSDCREFSSRNSSRIALTGSSPLSTVLHFVDFVGSLNNVSYENEVFIKLIQRVRQDEAEAERLQGSSAVTAYLESWPDKKTWIDEILHDVRRSLDDIGLYIQDGRPTVEASGTVGMKYRFEWILSHHNRLLTRQNSLVACHQSLMAAVQMLQMVELNGVYGSNNEMLEVPFQPWIQQEGIEVLRSPHSRQKWRSSQKNSSLPSITVSKPKERIRAYAFEEIPVELPGSTPDGVHEHVQPASGWTMDAKSTKYQGFPELESSSEFRQRPKSSSDHVTSLHVQTDKFEEKLKLSRPRSSSDVRTSYMTSQPTFGLSQLQDDLLLRDSRIPARDEQILEQVTLLPGLDREVTHKGQKEVLKQWNSMESSIDEYDVDGNVAGTHGIAGSAVSLNENNSGSDSEKHPQSLSFELRTASFPVYAKRYRPKAVHVRTPIMKHQSLPSELPHLTQQPSLISELSQYVVPVVDSGSNEYCRMSSDGFVELAASNTSITSTPVVPNTAVSCPERAQSEAITASKHASSLSAPLHSRQSSMDSSRTAPVSSTSRHSRALYFSEHYTTARPAVKNAQDSESKDNTSLNTVIPEAQSYQMVHRRSRTIDSPTGDRVNYEDKDSTSDIHRHPAKFPDTTEAESTNCESAVVIEGRYTVTSVQRPDSLVTTVQPEPAEMEAKPFLSEAIISSTEALSSPIVSLEPVGLGLAMHDSKVGTSQMKRRRAHARRMQAAYGVN